MISVDANSNSGGHALSSSYSWSHTCSGIELVLVVGVGCGGVSATGVTYGGKALTQLRNDGTSPKSALFYLIAPPVGTSTVVVSLSSALGTSISGATSFNGVDQVNPVNANGGNSGVASSPSVTVTPTVQGSVIMDCTYTTANAVMTALGSQSVDWSVADAVNLQAATSSNQNVNYQPLPVTQAYSSSSLSWAESVLSLNPALPQIPPATDRSVDPATPAAAIAFKYSVVGY